VNVAVVAPANTVTLAGTVANAFPLDRVTTEPPTGAAGVIVTVPVDEFPPSTLGGFKTRFDTVTGFTVKF
jgi:hypothetical protein